MNDGKEVSDRLQGIQGSLSSIIESSTRLLQRLKDRERSVRIASSVLTGFLGLVIGAIIASILSQSIPYLFVFNPKVAIILVGPPLITGVASGVITYLLLKRRHKMRLEELSSLIAEMENTNEQSAISHGIIEDAIRLADKTTTLLPQLVRRRHQDSILFGVVAFLVSDIITRSVPVAVLIGAIVWLYFRYENSRSYEREISRLELQRRAFEERRNNLMETLNALVEG